jgi:hypothetical protein
VASHNKPGAKFSPQPGFYYLVNKDDQLICDPCFDESQYGGSEIWATFKDNCLHPEGWLLVKSMLDKQVQVDPDEEVPMEDEDLEDAIEMVDRAHPQAAPTPFKRLKVADLIGDEEADDESAAG